MKHLAGSAPDLKPTKHVPSLVRAQEANKASANRKGTVGREGTANSQ